MNICCVICSDLFTPNSDMYSTPCGHIFHYTCLSHWLENSKTCPQCRAKVYSKSLVRLYINISQILNTNSSVTELQYKLDNAEFNIKLKDKEMKSLANKNTELETQNSSLRTLIKDMQLEESKQASRLLEYKDQLKKYKEQVQGCDKLKNDIRKFKNDIRNLENMQIALKGTQQQVADIVRNENNIENLAVLVSILKNTLAQTETKKNKLVHEVGNLKQEMSEQKRSYEDLTVKYEDIRMQFENLKHSYEVEIKFLKDKFVQLKTKINDDSINNSIRRITEESPVNYHRTPVLVESKNHVIELLDTSSDSPLVTSLTETNPDLTTTSQSSRRLNNVIQETTNDSPLPASSMGLFGIQRAKRLANSKNSQYSIFKTSGCMEKSNNLVKTVSDGKNSMVMYNGLGGSSKEDIFPTPGQKRSKPRKMDSRKMRKLSAAAGKVATSLNFK
ncbi:hypothetical protein ABEB36_002118 [Hypothenemus hampei]|uniref:RING-type domain-containing protein n=1 Tax=Hypothenemus hampei TaxID=57062 RepID=A0ABD1F4L6_HYPHA